MRLVSFLLLVFAVTSSFNLKSPDTCDIKVNVKFISQTEVEIDVTNGAEPIKYFIVDEENKTVSEGKKNIKNLAKGKFKYFIHDGNGCWKKGDFEIK